MTRGRTRRGRSPARRSPAGNTRGSSSEDIERATETPATEQREIRLKPGAAVFLASRNAKKLAELERIVGAQLPGLRILGLDDVSAYPEPVEDAPDFEGNALLKARAGFAATRMPTLADDSGICVDALNGMPGVLSARWSGSHKDDDRNNRLLLDQLNDVPDERRTAQFRCVVAFVHAGGESVVEGVMPGRVIRQLRGEGGFGYDVLFVPTEQEHPESALARTSAEMDAETKDAISHRGRSLRAITPAVLEALGE